MELVKVLKTLFNMGVSFLKKYRNYMQASTHQQVQTTFWQHALWAG